MPPKFGAHMSAAGGAYKAVEAAHAIGFDAVQLFTKNNAQWKAPPVREDQAQAFKDALARLKIGPAVVHASYLINMASPKDDLWEKSINAMVDEVERCAAFGIPDLVVHPGAHDGSGEEAGLARIAKALDQVDERTRGLAVTIDLETTAAAGTVLGGTIEHLAAVLGAVRSPERLGICCDTCHLFVSGRPLAEEEDHERLVEDLARLVGLEKVRAWHVNDSVKGLGSRVDRHAAIGRGTIGLAPFGRLVNDPRLRHAPLLLETPKGTEDGVDLDLVNLQTLRSLLRPD